MLLSLISVIVTLWVSGAHGQGRTCDFPEIKHGNIYEENRYKQTFPVDTGKYFYYTCDPSFASPSQSLWTRITCTEEGWSPTPKCIRQCFFPWVENGHSASSGQTHEEGDTVHVVCDTGYSLPGGQRDITCLESGWSPAPTCSRPRLPCGPPPSISNDANPNRKNRYEHGEEFTYRCAQGFTVHGPASVTCSEGKWGPPPECIKSTCPSPPSFDNAIARGLRQNKRVYQSGEEVAYECRPYYQMDGSNVVQCMHGRWIGKPTCRDTSCGSPPEVENANIRNPQTRYLPGDTVLYECIRPFDPFGEVEVTCLNGRWTEPPQCKESRGKCGAPPAIDNGDITTFPSAVYAPGASVEYQCQAYYELQGNRKVTCRDGEWSEPPRCLEPCVVSEETMAKHKIQLRWKDERKLYSRADDIIEFTCQNWYSPKSPRSAFRVRCREGNIAYPTCE